MKRAALSIGMICAAAAAAAGETWSDRNRPFPSFSPEAMAERAEAQRRSEELHDRGERIARKALDSICRGCSETKPIGRAQTAAVAGLEAARHRVRPGRTTRTAMIPYGRATRKLLIAGFIYPAID